MLAPISSAEDMFLLNGITGERSYLPLTQTHWPYNARVSPDHHWIAYFADEKEVIIGERLLVVANLADGPVYERQLLEKDDWTAIDAWINDETIQLERFIIDPEQQLFINPTPISFLDPFTGTSMEFEMALPNMMPFFDPNMSWITTWKSGVSLDPTQTLAAYGVYDAENRSQQIALWDLDKSIEVAHITAAVGYGDGPVWAPDGSSFISDSILLPGDEPNRPEELLGVTREGHISRLTFLSDHFPKVSIDSYVWSPESSKVAFWLSLDDAQQFQSEIPEDQFAVLDLATRRIVGLCLEGPPFYPPVWSPDGRYLLVAVTNAEKSEPVGYIVTDTFLIDINAGALTKIADEAFPVGWMLEP